MGFYGLIVFSPFILPIWYNSYAQGGILMKKILAALLAILMLFGCTSKKVDVDVNEIMDKVLNDDNIELPAGQLLDDETLETIYGISMDDIENYAVYVPMMNVHATEIAMFKVKNMDNVKKGVEDRLTFLDEMWSMYLPAQYELVQNHMLIEKDGYYFMIISNYNDDIANIIQGFFE